MLALWVALFFTVWSGLDYFVKNKEPFLKIKVKRKTLFNYSITKRGMFMNAEIIAVGSELLLGQIVNTNARFLSKSFS